jgi:hypothetical protein
MKLRVPQNVGKLHNWGFSRRAHLSSSETSVDFERTTRRYIPEDRTIHTEGLVPPHQVAPVVHRTTRNLRNIDCSATVTQVDSELAMCMQTGCSVEVINLGAWIAEHRLSNREDKWLCCMHLAQPLDGSSSLHTSVSITILWIFRIPIQNHRRYWNTSSFM